MTQEQVMKESRRLLFLMAALFFVALVAHGVRAEEIINATRLEVHKLTPFAWVDGTVITYPPQVR